MPLEDPQKKYQRRRRSVENSDDMTDAEKEFLFQYLDAYDPDNLLRSPPDDDSTHEFGTLKQKASIFKRFAEQTDDDVTDTDADDVNQYLMDMQRGVGEDMPDDGYAPNTVKQAALGLRVIYDYHGTIAKDEIAMPEGEDSKVTEEDMFTEGEIQSLRDACPNARDRCILELLIFTGQRVRAIQTLRIKDLDLEEGLFRINPTVDGLKGADGKRPLLGAVGPIRRWLQRHPASDDPEAYLITCLPRTSTGVPGEPIATEHIQRRMRELGREAGVEKPTNPHQFRHYFVTVCKRDYDLSDSEIKHLLGHRPDSNVMETTYSHLTDEEVSENVSVKAGFKEKAEDESPLSPPTCTSCDEPLPDNARACPVCGTTFTPDAKAAEDQIQDMLYQGRAEDDGEHADTIDALRQEIRENPEMKQAILAELLDEK